MNNKESFVHFIVLCNAILKNREGSPYHIEDNFGISIDLPQDDRTFHFRIPSTSNEYHSGDDNFKVLFSRNKLLVLSHSYHTHEESMVLDSDFIEEILFKKQEFLEYPDSFDFSWLLGVVPSKTEWGTAS